MGKLKEFLQNAISEADRRKYGSFSERNPQLGKMVKCSFCGHRRREKETCCNPKFSRFALSANGKLSTGKIHRRRRNPHRSQKVLVIHQRTLEMLRTLHENPLTRGKLSVAHVALITARQVLGSRRAASAAAYEQQSTSRRINRSR